MKMVDAIGLDMSKETFDARIHTTQLSHKFPNKKAGFRLLLKWASTCGLNLAQVRFCAENTGLYSESISEFMTAQKMHFSLLPALEIKRSLGITRGKDDELDAQRIAQYTYLRRDVLKDFTPLSDSLKALKKLVGLRRKLVSTRHRFEVTIAESRRVLHMKEHKVYFMSQQKMVIQASKQIQAVEKEIERLIASEQELQKMNLLLQSVVGIGPVIAAHLIAFTGGFSRFKTWRQFACYICVAPFPYTSGSSVHGKSRVSHLANKELKSLMHLSASTAIQHDPELKLYYKHRLKEGKSEMSSLNIVRNKILARVFAVIKRQTPYVKTHAYAA